MIPKCSNLVQGMILGYPTSYVVLGLKGQRSMLGLTAIWRGFELYERRLVSLSVTYCSIY